MRTIDVAAVLTIMAQDAKEKASNVQKGSYDLYLLFMGISEILMTGAEKTIQIAKAEREKEEARWSKDRQV